jgi:hypothetical protein
MALRPSRGASEVDDDEGDELELLLPDGDDRRKSMREADEWRRLAQGGWRRRASVKVVGMRGWRWAFEVLQRERERRVPWPVGLVDAARRR